MTSTTARMISNLSGDLFPFLLPLVATIIFANRHGVKFNNSKLQHVCGVFLVWSLLVIVKMSLYSTYELSYYFFLFYAILVAYVHTKGYGRKFFPCFEEVMVLFCKIALVGWAFCNTLPGIASSIMHQFPETQFGNNFLYIFNWMDPLKMQMYRNAGISWEPGRFAIMIIMAIVVNLSREGIKFKGNKNIYWLLFALASTMSTTGYVTAIVLYSLFWMKKWNVRTILSYCIFLVPLIYIMISLEFVGEKLQERSNVIGRIENFQASIDYANSIGEDEYKGSLDRFESMFFEVTVNIPNDPIVGYGRNNANSYYSNNISTAFILSGGLLKVLSQYGLPFGFLIYFLLYKSSVFYANENNYGKRFAVFIALLLSSISYPTFCTPIFNTFWMYGLFSNSDK